MPTPAARPRRSRRPAHSLALAAALALGPAVLLAGCSSASSGSTTSTSTALITTLPSTAASRAEIAHAYSVLFDLADPAVAPKLAVVSGATGLKATFVAALHSALAKLAGGAKVHTVTLEQGAACGAELVTSPCAKVTYAILSPKGKVLLPGSVGLAVYSGGHWLVAKSTICTLLALENGNKTPAGC